MHGGVRWDSSNSICHEMVPAPMTVVRKTPASFGGPLSLIYIAGNVTEADRAERILTGNGVEYALSLNDFTHNSVLGSVFGGVYTGLFFFVPAADHQRACKMLEAGGLTGTIDLKEEERSEQNHGA
jgi:hypothetical protein